MRETAINEPRCSPNRRLGCLQPFLQGMYLKCKRRCWHPKRYIFPIAENRRVMQEGIKKKGRGWGDLLVRERIGRRSSMQAKKPHTHKKKTNRVA